MTRGLGGAGLEGEATTCKSSHHQIQRISRLFHKKWEAHLQESRKHLQYLSKLGVNIVEVGVEIKYPNFPTGGKL